MRVLIFTVCFPPVINGVSTRYLQTVRELRKLGHEVHVATPVHNAPEDYYGARVYKVPGFKMPLNEFCHSEYLDFYDSYSIITKVNPDIVHVCAPTWIQFGVLLWCYLKSIPVILSYHTHVPEYVKHYGLGIIGTFISWFLWQLVVFSHKRCSLTMVTSSAMGDELKAHGVDTEIRVWRKGVDIELLNPCKGSAEVRQKLMNGPPKELLLLYVGRLSMEKSLHFLVPVLEDERVRRRTHVAFVGDGPIREKLETETFGHLADCVSFHGFITGEDLSAVYASSDAFIFPSETETLGLVAIEAMAGGLPVIGVRARGIAVTIKDGETGFLYEPGDVEGCIGHILTMLNSPSERVKLAKNARADAEQWGWDKATAQLLDTYNEVIAKHKIAAYLQANPKADLQKIKPEDFTIQ